MLKRTFVTAALAAPFLNLKAQTIFTGGDASDLEAAKSQGFWERPRWVWLKRPATGETIKKIYWRDGQLIEQAYSDVSWLLRDVRFERMMAMKSPIIQTALNNGRIDSKQVSPWIAMDAILLDILYAYSAWLDFNKVQSPILITSGFRHVLTNALTEGAARNSEHTKGGAADIVIPNVSPIKSAAFGKFLAGGGVGLYASRNFVHVDKGNVRSWGG